MDKKDQKGSEDKRLHPAAKVGLCIASWIEAAYLIPFQLAMLPEHLHALLIVFLVWFFIGMPATIVYLSHKKMI